MKSVDQEYKKVVFYLQPERHARFLLYLKYHDFKNQGIFFRSVVQACLEDDETMFKLLTEMKENVSKRRIKISQKEHAEMKENIKNFNLTQEEVDDIFSLIEGESEDL